MTQVKEHKRKMVECGRKRVPLKKLLNGKEIRAAAAALEEFRLHLNEAEFMYGAKITLQMGEYGECTAVAKRPETDSEFDARIEKARQAEIAKQEREVKRKLAAEEKAKRDEELRRVRTIEHLKSMMKTNNVTLEDLN